MLHAGPYGLAAVLSCAAMMTLQGCGGGGSDGHASTTTTTLTTTTTTTVPTGPSGLYWCEDLVTYYKTSYNNATKSAAGQCWPSASPGAYYTKQGQTAHDGKNDKVWECFSPSFEHSLWTNEAAKAKNFEGACLFKDYSSKATPGTVDFCSKHLSHHPAVCGPGPEMYWGACWSSHSENWRCIRNGDATIPGLAKGDCKAIVLMKPSSSEPTGHFYDGVCRFHAESNKIYKCDTVPDYAHGDASKCGQDVDKKSDKACFSLKSGVEWQCIEKGTNFTRACDWILQPGESREFYKGSCVFPRDKEQYKKAIDAHNLTATFQQHVIV